jgi:hypothetical protein
MTKGFFGGLDKEIGLLSSKVRDWCSSYVVFSFHLQWQSQNFPPMGSSNNFFMIQLINLLKN